MTHVELHNHTHYSVLDGASTPEEYLKRAKELGMDYMAITDHGSTAGHREFQREAKKVGIKPILGVEAYITTDRFDRTTAAKREDGTGVYNHITLLAQDAKGLKNLEHMQKLAWTEGFYHKPRIDLELLEAHSDGIIALSGCMSGMVAKPLLNGKPEMAVEYAGKFKDILGDRFYIEVMESNSEVLNRKLMTIGRKLGIEPVVTSDCHMARKEDLPLADIMLVLSTNPKKRHEIEHSRTAKMEMMDALDYLYPERKMTFAEFELYLHSYDEHQANLERHGISELPVQNTLKVASTIGEYDYAENLDTLPVVGDQPMEELRRRTYQGLKDRGIDTPENRERVAMELEVIEKKNLATYFLIEIDFIDYAKENNILTGYGRGSAVSYLTNYANSITRIDPMPYDLLPERFLSLDREDPADIDTDLAIDGRYAVKAYAVRKYGHVSNIATVGYYKDKSAIKAAAKAFKAPFGETQKLLNRVTSIDEFATSSETADYRTKYPHVVKVARMLNGRIQNFGMHAGGIILSKNPIEDIVPLQTANDPSDPAAGRVAVAAADMRELADMGFVKYDLLGLRTLSIVDDTIKMVKERHGVDIDIEKIPLDDANLYKMMSEGRTSGLFQAEAGASTKTILDMGGVNNFAELVASNALVRPGAANSTVGSTYITGKKTGEIKKLHPSIDPVLEETFGAVLYQEQQLLLCEYVAGMSKADSNKVRKAISKKILADLEVWKDAFIQGATKNVGASKAEEIWKDLEASADYAFAKAHAVGYSMLTLLTAYLKYYYPIEFLVACLNRMNAGSKVDRMKMLKYLIEAKRLGIKVRLPHVNSAAVKHTIRQNDDGDDFIQLGLSQVKYISDKTAAPIIAAAPYADYEDFLNRSGANRRAITSLNMVGGAAFPDNPRTGKEMKNFFTYLSLPSFDTKDIPPKMFASFRPLIDYTEDEAFVCMGIVGGDKKKPGWRLIDIVDESGVASAFVSEDCDIEVGQVYVFLIANNSVLRWATTEEITKHEGDVEFIDFLRAEGYPDLTDGFARVVSFNSRKTKKGDYMANAVFADETKELISALVWPSMFPLAHTKCKPGASVEVTFAELQDGGYAISTIEGMSK